MPDIQGFTDNELLDLLHDIESDRVERKRNFSNGDTARQAVCAFANDLPGHNQAGVLFIGAEDNGKPSYITVTDQLIRDLSDMARDGKTLPLPVMAVEKRLLDGAEMAVVTVKPSDMPPVKFDGRIWIRIGGRRALANEQEERILIERRKSRNFLPFDISPVPSAKLSDLSKIIFENEYLPAAFAPDVLEENNRTYEERLSSCRMIVSPDDTTPTVLGLLTIGKSPQDFMYGGYIQFLRIDGTELGDPVIDELKATGSLAGMIHRVEEKLTAHNKKAYDISKGAHVITEDYPPRAMQQILYNAVLHRTYEGTNAPVHVYWYNDRIEISSPGGPYGRVTAENFGVQGIVDYRNPNLAEAMKNIGLVQRFGQGISAARQAMRQNSNPPPEFDTKFGGVLCILRAKK
ncbi:MAG: putative DNA binding domain-containing protein [Treponema sp.]|jgi:ATP-dependent DNA helicase RecG|nr:putative DNA binding domain-containing protein [Treponema sp.]